MLLTDGLNHIGKKVRYKDDGCIGTIIAITCDEYGEMISVESEFYGICGESWKDLEFVSRET